MNDENTRVVDGLYISDGTTEGTWFLPRFSDLYKSLLRERGFLGDLADTGGGLEGTEAADARLTRCGKIAGTALVMALGAVELHLVVKIVQRIWNN